MKILLTRNTVIDGQHCDMGSVVDADPQVASLLIRMGKAQLHAKQQPLETAVVHPPETAELVQLVGKGPANALLEAGLLSLADVREALEAGRDLTEISGVGNGTVSKLDELLEPEKPEEAQKADARKETLGGRILQGLRGGKESPDSSESEKAPEPDETEETPESED